MTASKPETIPRSTRWLLALSLIGFGCISVAVSTPQLAGNIPGESAKVVGLILVWVLTGAVLYGVRRAERRPVGSIGLKPTTPLEILGAIVIGVVLSISVPLLSVLASYVIPVGEGGGIESTAQSVPVIIVLAGTLTAGITEEILFRGYAMERLLEFTGRWWIAIGIPLLAFVLPHLVSWNLAHVVGVVLPLGLILSAIYLWRRNCVFNIIVHTVINLPLVFMAAAN
jgi:uncharacterized protein